MKDGFIFKRHIEIPMNEYGNDYFVGDIHAQYDLLMTTLEKKKFNLDCDRLFSVGDLIDRGPANIETVNLLNKPWFYSVMGNHEQMFIQGGSNLTFRYIHQGIGGAWTIDYPDDVLQLLRDTLLRHCPLTMTVQQRKGRIGVVHATVEETWKATTESYDYDTLLWIKRRFKEARAGKDITPLEDIECVVSGHLKTETPLVGANHVWIDTFKATGELTVISAKELFGIVQST